MQSKKKKEQVTIHEAKTHLSRLLAEVTGGREVIIAKGNQPVAKLIPFRKPLRERVAGIDAGKGWIEKDFNAPLSKKILKDFYK